MDGPEARALRLAASALLLLAGCEVGIDDEVFDAGVRVDGGVRADAGAATQKQDAGAGSASEDGGSTPDAGTPWDSGSAGGADAGQDAGPDGPSTPPKPSAGCGKGGRPSGGTVTVANDHIFTFPTTYDGTTPFPLLMGFHAASNPIDQIRNLTNGSDFEKTYVRAFPKSAGSAWSYNTDRSRVIAVYDELMANYCIDMRRVFATGHSSGAQMIVQILTKPSDAAHFGFRAVAPVAASNYGAIASPIPVMYIQGAKDTERRSDGADVVAQFTRVNQCTTSTQPDTSVGTCKSSGASVKPGCVEYQGCTQPTLWCSHDDSAYAGTSHGWPCFATKAMYDFFTALP